MNKFFTFLKWWVIITAFNSFLFILGFVIWLVFDIMNNGINWH